MNESLTQKIRNNFDQIALHDEQGWNHNNHYHHFLLKQLPKKCNTVLDIGCGTGEFYRLLAKGVNQVIALDLSPNMIKVAKEHSTQYTNIDFQVADVLQWDFPVAQFDAIVSIATVHHLSLENLLPNLKVALKPGGRLVILDLLQNENMQDIFSDFVAVPLNWLFEISRNKHIQSTPEAAAAMKEHIRTDKYLTLSQARRIYTSTLGKAQVRKHLFWRYSIVWENSVAASQIN
ncbi:class I SAM-dependent methyltransferase [Nodularia chucula]|uniref:class I SAM-dependent methyltransferase n=1 Tax=Nodularia chucula TaxID=3093667 RepID=UPI0039C639E8